VLDCFVAFALRNDKKIPLLRHLCAGFTRASRSVCCPSAARIARAVETLVCVTYQKLVGVGIAYLLAFERPCAIGLM
jgi:hypothetical protein